MGNVSFKSNSFGNISFSYLRPSNTHVLLNADITSGPANAFIIVTSAFAGRVVNVAVDAMSPVKNADCVADLYWIDVSKFA